MFRTICLLVPLLIGQRCILAQDSISSPVPDTLTVSNGEPFVLSLYLNSSFPLGDFKKAVDNPEGGAGFGVGGNMMFNLKGQQQRGPLAIGLDFSYLTFGRDKIDATSTTPPYKTTFNYYSICPILRVIPTDRETGFTPFVDGMIGVKIFNTRTKIDKNALNVVLNNNQPEVIHTTNDAGLGYGLGAGWYVRKKSEGPNSVNASFTFRVMYLWGDPTSYVKRGSLMVDGNGNVNYETGHTNTNMLLVQLGLSLH